MDEQDNAVDPRLQQLQDEVVRLKHERDQLLGTQERFGQALSLARAQDQSFAARLEALWSTGQLPPAQTQTTASDGEPDLMDPTQLARFIKDTIREETQSHIAPLQKSALENRTTTEYMRLAGKVGQENLDRAMPKIQALISEKHLTLDSLPGGLETIYKLATYDEVGTRAIESFQQQEQQRQQQAQQIQGLPINGKGGPLPDVQKQLQDLSYGSDEFNAVLSSLGKQMGMKE